jgi:hypothetical protein
MSSRSEMPASAAPKEEDDSGIPGLSMIPAPESLKDRELASAPAERLVKAPHLPFGENVALVTGAIAA